MARNREPSISESGEDDESSCEEVESDSEPKQTATATPKKSQPQLPVKSQQPPPPAQSQPPSSSEEEESGSETSSDSDGADSNVKPLASKPMKEAHGARRTRSKANSPEAVTPAKPSAAKRPCEDTARPSENTVVSKDAKKIADPKASEKKPIPFHRLWSEEDEIIILKGMIEYSSKNNCNIDPIPDMDGFGDFIKKSLHRKKFSRIQLKDKIKKLKAKYKEKEKEGTEMRFGKLHEQSVYELSKEIWYKENGVSSPKANGSVGRKKAKRAMVVEGERLNLNLNPNASGEERMLRSGREIYEVEQAGLEGEEEWSKLGVEEWELYLKQLELRIAQTKLVLNAIKGGGDHH